VAQIYLHGFASDKAAILELRSDSFAWKIFLGKKEPLGVAASIEISIVVVVAVVYRGNTTTILKGTDDEDNTFKIWPKITPTNDRIARKSQTYGGQYHSQSVCWGTTSRRDPTERYDNHASGWERCID
jgi:hypothetical protein